MGEAGSLCQEVGRGDRRPLKTEEAMGRQLCIEPVSVVSEKGP